MGSDLQRKLCSIRCRNGSPTSSVKTLVLGLKTRALTISNPLLRSQAWSLVKGIHLVPRCGSLLDKQQSLSFSWLVGIFLVTQRTAHFKFRHEMPQLEQLSFRSLLLFRFPGAKSAFSHVSTKDGLLGLPWSSNSHSTREEFLKGQGGPRFAGFWCFGFGWLFYTRILKAKCSDRFFCLIFYSIVLKRTSQKQMENTSMFA